MTIVAATSPLYPPPRTPSSLAWDKLWDHSGGAANPICSGRKSAPPRLTGSLYPASLFLLGWPAP